MKLNQRFSLPENKHRNGIPNERFSLTTRIISNNWLVIFSLFMMTWSNFRAGIAGSTEISKSFVVLEVWILHAPLVWISESRLFRHYPLCHRSYKSQVNIYTYSEPHYCIQILSHRRRKYFSSFICDICSRRRQTWLSTTSCVITFDHLSNICVLTLIHSHKPHKSVTCWYSLFTFLWIA